MTTQQTMIANKAAFFRDLSSQIAKPIYLTDKTDEINEEIKYNHWVLSVPSDIIAQTTTSDFLEFIQNVKDNYKSQLDKSSLDIDLTFYLWFDVLEGLCFNFINSNHQKLPFGCKLKYTYRPEEIVSEYLKSNSRDKIITWDELRTVEKTEETAKSDRIEKDLHNNFVLTVYQERIKKMR